MAKHPAFASALASSTRPRAASAVRPCTLKPPITCSDCGVSPMWPMTGISASTSASTIGTRLRPPSSFTACAPARTSAAALRTVSLRRHVVAHPREIADDQRFRSRPGDRRDVVGHVVDRELQRVVVAEHDHRDGVADEDDVGAAVVDHARRRRVVRGHHDERERRPFGRAQRAQSSKRPWPVLLPVQRHEAAGGRAQPTEMPANRASSLAARGGHL